MVQEKLVKYKNKLEELQIQRHTYYSSLTNKLNVLDNKKREIIRAYNQNVKTIDNEIKSHERKQKISSMQKKYAKK